MSLLSKRTFLTGYKYLALVVHFNSVFLGLLLEEHLATQTLPGPITIFRNVTILEGIDRHGNSYIVIFPSFEISGTINQ